MYRLYQVKSTDFTKDDKVRYIRIDNIVGLDLIYDGTLYNGESSLVIPISRIEDVYIQSEGEVNRKGVLLYALSYDGNLYSDVGEIEFRFKEYVERFDIIVEYNIISTYMTPNKNIDYKYLLAKLYKSKNIDISHPVVIVPLLSCNAIPDKAKVQLSHVTIEDIPYYAKVYLEDSDNNILDYSELSTIDTSVIDNVYLVLQDYTKYSDDIVITIGDSLSKKEQLVLGDISFNGKSFLEISIDEYNKLAEND